MPPWEAGKLTRQQAAHLYFRPRQQNGMLQVYGIPGRSQPAAADYRTQFWERYRKQGVGEERIAELWAEHRARQADVRRRALERQREAEKKHAAQRRRRKEDNGC